MSRFCYNKFSVLLLWIFLTSVNCGPIENEFSNEKIEHLKQYAENYSAIISKEIDPCDDFREYVCSDNYDFIYDDFDFDKIYAVLKNCLNDENLSEAEIKLKTYLRSCENFPDESIIESLKEPKFLESIKTWPAFNPNWKGDDLDVISLGLELEAIRIPTVLRIGHYKLDDPDRTELAIDIEKSIFFKDEDRQEELKKLLSGLELANVDEVLNDCVELDKQLGNLMQDKDEKLVTNFEGFKKEFPQIDWNKEMKIIFDHNINDDHPVIVKRPETLKKIINLLLSTDKKTIANYYFSNLVFYFPKITKGEEDQTCYSYATHFFESIETGLLLKKFLKGEKKEIIVGMINAILEALKEFQQSIGNEHKPSCPLPESAEDAIDDYLQSQFNDLHLKTEFETVKIEPNNFIESTFQLRRHRRHNDFMHEMEEKPENIMDEIFTSLFVSNIYKFDMGPSPINLYNIGAKLILHYVRQIKDLGAIYKSKHDRECFKDISDEVFYGVAIYEIFNKAYNNWASKHETTHNEENKIFDKYGLSMEKLAQIRLMQNVCTSSQERFHKPAFFLLRNDEHFLNAFPCPVDTKFSSDEKCKLSFR